MAFVLLLYVAGVLVVSLTVGQYVWFGSALILVPVVAAGLLATPWTLAMGVLCTASLLGLYGFIEPSDEPLGDWLTIGSVAVVSVICVALARVRAERNETLARARVSLEVLQRALLPELPVVAPGARLDGFYAAAEAEARLGGDLYEVVESPYGIRVLIGDVQGKGLDAVGTGASVLAAFREAGYYQPALEGVAERLENAVTRHHRRADRPDQQRFVTALLLELNGARAPGEGEMRMVSCGHVPPLLFGGPGDGPVREALMEEPGLPLGLASLTRERRRAEGVALEGRRVLLCTDGVTEARDAAGRFYPLAERLSRWSREPAPELLRALRADLERHVGADLGDDAVVLVVTVEPGGA
ncbi:PP2C family protein-serine/threonine phosphatase [Streptomyces sp. ODS28]|uniref:PP2C family protein-serine/threonine phosphatase n=1 Tax=Streptomyces sp. ODS28 TaxID=3136688 RepID=UPI0031EB0E04